MAHIKLQGRQTACDTGTISISQKGDDLYFQYIESEEQFNEEQRDCRTRFVAALSFEDRLKRAGNMFLLEEHNARVLALGSQGVENLSADILDFENKWHYYKCENCDEFQDKYKLTSIRKIIEENSSLRNDIEEMKIAINDLKN